MQATFAGGCFWCTEAVFAELRGVARVLPGYMGGSVDEPTYEQVCTGQTGHAEVIQIEFDESVIDFTQLLKVFFGTHNPTTLNRQGADVGTQYRSAVFFHSEDQREQARHVIDELTRDQVFDGPIVTTLERAASFFAAEDYHHDYFARNPNQGYCAAVVAPKVQEFREQFASWRRDSS
jgi:peptide-methionine (S)-S-oxide reductase